MSGPQHTLDQLLVLSTVAREGSFAAAARALHRVPSAISYTVKQLEEATGVTVFSRAGRTVSLTDAGRRLLEEARGVLHAAQHLDRLASALSTGWEPELTIVVDGAWPLAPLHRATASLTQVAPGTRVRLLREYQSGVQARFADGADLMIMLAFEGTGDQVADRLPPLPMLLTVGRAHPLAAAPPTEATAWADQVEIVVGDSGPDWRHRPRPSWFGCHQVVECSDFHAKRDAILDGLGFGWLPRWLVEEELKSGSLVAIPLADGAGTWTYHPRLVHRRELLGRAGTHWRSALLSAGPGRARGAAEIGRV